MERTLSRSGWSDGSAVLAQWRRIGVRFLLMLASLLLIVSPWIVIAWSVLRLRACCS